MSDKQETAEALFSLFYELPIPVDTIYYENDHHAEIETMILRAGRVYFKQPYTYTDCFVVRYASRRSPFGAGRPLRVLDAHKLEAKRREYFGHAFRALVAELELRELECEWGDPGDELRRLAGVCLPIPPQLTYTYADMRCFAPCTDQLQGRDCPCLVRARREAGRVPQ